MKLSAIEENLVSAFGEFEIVDAHEHIPPERVRLDLKVDALTLFSCYTRTDLITAGMPEQVYDKIHDPAIPLEERWKLFSPHLKNIRYGSYVRPAFMAAKEFYGFDDINDGNYKALSERMAEENKPGIYRRVLREKCRIRVALTQDGVISPFHSPRYYDLDLLKPLMFIDDYASVRSKKDIDKSAANVGIRTIDDYLDLTRKGIEQWMAEGGVGLKLWRLHDEPDRGQAVALFDSLMRDEKRQLPEWNPLRTYLTDNILSMAAELGLVVGVHTGMWGDFRTLDPKLLIPAVIRHPETKFDIYHMGMPWVRDTGIIGKNFPNVWLNLCWSHIISPKMVCSALDEWIDLVPMNKIIAFGGDYDKQVEKIYGHLVMARENIARVLGGRVEDGLMTEEEAITIAKKWFYHNPKELYKLKI